MLYAHYQRYNPFRTPDWRWERVLKMCDRHPTPGRATKWDDDYVKRARNFLLLHRKIEDDEDRAKLFWEEPGLTYAYDIFEKSNGENATPALLIEARLLARCDMKAIAHEARTIPEAIDWYEALFFNVSDGLTHRDWITTHVLLPAILRNKGLRDDNADVATDSMFSAFKNSEIAKPFLDASLKFFAYFGGPHLIDHMITGFQQGNILESQDHLAAWYDKHTKLNLRKRSSQASGQFEINKFNAMELFAVHTAIMQLETSQDNIDAQKTTTEHHIQAMLEDIPWSVGEDAERLGEGTILGKLDQGAAEVRDDDIQRLAAGQKVDLSDLPQRIPPPRRKAPTLGSGGGFQPPVDGK